MSDISIERNEKFGGISVKTSLEEITKYGYKFGDSVTVEFTNGKKVENIPLSNSYCGKIGNSVFCFYPTYQYPHLANNLGSDLFTDLELTVNDKATMTLYKEAAYLDLHNVFQLQISKNRSDYSSDEEFANFRPIELGNAKLNNFYRGSSPVDNGINRVSYVCDLIEKNNIDYILDLSNEESDLEAYYNNSETIPTWKNYYENKKIFSVKLIANYKSEQYYAPVKKMCESITNNDGVFFFHCAEGKDRTGFIAIIFECLRDASVSDLEKDYMLTYKNFYKITKEDTQASYNAFYEYRFIDQINFVSGTDKGSAVTTSELHNGAVSYLKKCGLSDVNIEALTQKLNK